MFGLYWILPAAQNLPQLKKKDSLALKYELRMRKARPRELITNQAQEMVGKKVLLFLTLGLSEGLTSILQICTDCRKTKQRGGQWNRQAVHYEGLTALKPLITTFMVFQLQYCSDI